MSRSTAKFRFYRLNRIGIAVNTFSQVSDGALPR